MAYVFIWTRNHSQPFKKLLFKFLSDLKTVDCLMCHPSREYRSILLVENIPSIQHTISPAQENDRRPSWAPAAVSQALSVGTRTRVLNCIYRMVRDFVHMMELSFRSSDQTFAHQSPTDRNFWRDTDRCYWIGRITDTPWEQKGSSASHRLHHNVPCKYSEFYPWDFLLSGCSRIHFLN